MTAQTPEGRIKAMVKLELSKHPTVWAFWPVQAGYGSTTLDCLGCAYGHPFAIETKRPGGKLTSRQESDAENMHQAGMVIFKIDGPHSAELLAQWLNWAHATPVMPHYQGNLHGSPDTAAKSPA